MITVSNYQNEIKNVDWSKLPKEVKAQKSDIENILQFYNDDKDIAEAIDDFIELANMAYAKKQKPKSKPKVKIEDARKPEFEPGTIVRGSNIDGTSIELVFKTKDKYAFVVDGKSTLVGTYEEMNKKFEDHKSYLSNLQKQGVPKKTRIATTAKKSKKPAKTAKSSRKNTVATKAKKEIAKKVDKKSVDNYSNLFKLLRRFKNFIEKEKVTFRQARLLFMAFNKAAVERKVRAKDENASLFNKANEAITKVFKTAEDNIEEAQKNGIEIKISDPKKFDDIIEFVSSKQIDVAIRLLKRFISLQGTKPEKIKVQRLIKSIENAIKKDKLDKNNRLYKDVVEAKKELKEYLKDTKEPVDVDMQGLSGVCNNRVKCEGITKNGQLKKGYRFIKEGVIVKAGAKGLKGVCENRVKCEGLTKNGQLKKGYKFTPGGNVVKVSKAKKKKLKKTKV